MKFKAVSLFNAYMDEAMVEAAAAVLRSGQIAAGTYVQRFQDGFGALIANPAVVTTSDMSSSMRIALHLAGVQPGDDVLTASFACMSTNGPIAAAGARPVWVDVDPETGVPDVTRFEQALTPKTRAVVLYHLAGYPGPAIEVAALCKAHGVALIEDCNNALLASIGETQVGGFGDFSIHSFYPNRQINATEGGALGCRDADHAARATRLRRFGIDLPRFRSHLGEIDPDCDIPEIGWAATLNNLCSAIGLAQLPEVTERLARTRLNAERISNRLSRLPLLSLVPVLDSSRPAYWALLLRVNRRDEVLAGLKARGIHVSTLHARTDAYSGFAVSPASLPGTAEFLRSVLGLPCGWWLDDADIDHLVESLFDVLDELRPDPLVARS